MEKMNRVDVLERKIAHARRVRIMTESHVDWLRLTRVISAYLSERNALLY